MCAVATWVSPQGFRNYQSLIHEQEKWFRSMASILLWEKVPRKGPGCSARSSRTPCYVSLSPASASFTQLWPHGPPCLFFSTPGSQAPELYPLLEHFSRCEHCQHVPLSLHSSGTFSMVPNPTTLLKTTGSIPDFTCSWLCSNYFNNWYLLPASTLFYLHLNSVYSWCLLCPLSMRQAPWTSGLSFFLFIDVSQGTY